MEVLVTIHSVVRWLILLAAVIALVKFALGWLRGGQFAGMDRGLAAGFSGLLDLQALLGILFLLWSGFAGHGFPLYRLEHGLAMIAAVVVGHLPARWKNADDRTRFRKSFLAILVALLFIFAGLAALTPGGGR